MIRQKVFRARRILAWMLAAFLVAVVGAVPVSSRAAIVPDLYQAAVPAADRSEAGLGAAFEAALRQVLVKVTGRRAAAQDPALAPLVASARRYMQQYRAGSGNQIWVAFDGPALERWLAQNGQPSWGKDRPVTLVLLAVPDSRGGGSVLGRDDNSDLKRALDQQASGRGIMLMWPSAADMQRLGVSYDRLMREPGSIFADSGKRLGAGGVLIGRADARPGTGIRWLFLFQGRSAEYSGAEEGVQRVADTYASLYAATGASVPVDFDVTGVGSLQTYAAVQAYLESLTQVSRIDVTGFDADAMHLRVVARGGLEPLQRVFAQDGRLQAEPGSGVPRFRAMP